MRQFHLSHLLVLTIWSAVAFAIARWAGWEGAKTFGVGFVIFAPIFCYLISAIVFSQSRNWRVRARQGLLAFTLASVTVYLALNQGSGAVSQFLGIAFLLWTPQLILLAFCSMYRGALVGASFYSN
ncbi:MAG: hypothetical protein AAF802_32385 [Planctomycetota bacterium]